jgi:hypothetical protein
MIAIQLAGATGDRTHPTLLNSRDHYAPRTVDSKEIRCQFRAWLKAADWESYWHV